VINVGLLANTSAPVPVSSVTALAKLAELGVARNVATLEPRPLIPVDIGRPVQLVRVPLLGVPSAGVTNVGLLANTSAPLPVSPVTAEARLALDGVARNVATPEPSPEIPVDTGSPVALVRVAADGVPRFGVVSEGLVANTNEPVPVSSVTALAKLAELGVARNVAIPVPRPLIPVETGRPVAFVSVAALGVPRFGVTNTGLLVIATKPLPDPSVKARLKLVDVGVARNTDIPAAIPLTPVDIGRPVQLVSVPLLGVPSAGVTSVGLVPNTKAPEPVSPVTADARLALDGVARNVATPVPRPLIPVETGSPVAFVRVAADGVPRFGVVSEGLVANTSAPDPVSSVTALAKLAELGVARNDATPAPRPLMPVDTGSPVALVRVAADGVPRFGVVSAGLVANTNEPDPVSSVTALAKLAELGVARNVAIPTPSPLTPVETGSPVALVSVAALGVPRFGVVSEGLVANTSAPDPVSSVTALAKLAELGVARNDATPAPRPLMPVDTGRPVQLVRVPLLGVPSAGVTSIGLVRVLLVNVWLSVRPTIVPTP
jgi:hypothetical protein